MSGWWTEDTVAVVTGANKGIGLEIVRQLGQKGLTVILTARNGPRGIAAVESLVAEGLQNVVFHELDVKSAESASCLAEWLRTRYGGIDILINNAGVNGMKPDFEYFESRQIPFLEAMVSGTALSAMANQWFLFNAEISNASASAFQSSGKPGEDKDLWKISGSLETKKLWLIEILDLYVSWSHGPFHSILRALNLQRDDSITEGFPIDVETARNCIETNYYGVKRVTAALLPLLRPGSRIINVSSTLGALKEVKNSTLRQKLSEVETLTEELVDDFVSRYLKDVELGNVENKEWPEKFAAYKLSKVALNAYSRVLARNLGVLQAGNKDKICVNCVHPGYIKSDLVYNAGGIEASEGAVNVVKIALLPPEEVPCGEIFMEGHIGNFF